jgi:hypothetical protein
MAFHADFWVLVGTAAPVFVLAAVVSASDSITARRITPTKRGLRRRENHDEHGPASLPYWLSGLAVIIQGFLLNTSLFSLANENSQLSVTLVLAAEWATIALLLFASLYVAVWRRKSAHGAAGPADPHQGSLDSRPGIFFERSSKWAGGKGSAKFAALPPGRSSKHARRPLCLRTCWTWPWPCVLSKSPLLSATQPEQGSSWLPPWWPCVQETTTAARRASRSCEL